MSTTAAVPAAHPPHLSAIDWVLPDPGESPWLWDAARSYRRELWKEMRQAARLARQEDEEQGRKAGVIYEIIAAGRMGDLEAAGELLIDAGQINDAEPMHHLTAGILMVQAGYPERSLDWFERAAGFGPEEPSAWAYLAFARSLAGDWGGTREAALRALALGAGADGLVNFCLASACVELGLPIDAEAGLPEGEPHPAGVEAPNRFAEVAPSGPVSIFVMTAADQLGEVQALLWSLKAARSACGLHLHVVNADGRTERLLERLQRPAIPVPISLSFERVAARNAAELRRRLRLLRLARFREFTGAHGGKVILADPGVLFRAAPEGWLAGHDAPVTLVPMDGGLILERYSGDLCAVRAGPEADAFLGAACAAADSDLFQASRLDRLDQAALWVGAQRVQPESAASAAWCPPGADEDFRRSLLDAAGDFQEVPARPEPVNELLPSVFGPMLVNRNDIHIARAIRARGGGEAVEELALLRQFIREGDTVLDIGANVGTHTVPFCQAVGRSGRVYAFEPQRVIYQVMVANVALNSALNGYCLQAAVGAKPGRLKVPGVAYDHPGNFGLVSFAWRRTEGLPMAGGDTGEEVEVVTVDGLGLSACQLIKIDVEGMEPAVLRGARRTIAAHRPIIYMESFDDPPGRAARKYLRGLSYRLFRHRVVGGENVLCVPAEADWSVTGFDEI